MNAIKQIKICVEYRDMVSRASIHHNVESPSMVDPQ